MNAMIQLVDSFRVNLPAHAGSNSHHLQKRRGIIATGITEAIESVLDRAEDQFTWAEIHSLLTRNNYEVKAKTPRTSIGSVLAKLVERKIIEVVRQGSSSNPSVYRVSKRR